MTDDQKTSEQASQNTLPTSSDFMSTGASNANVVYILYLAGLAIGLTALVGVVVAYVNKPKVSDWVQSHYIFQIQTFWKGLLFVIAGFLTMPLMGLGMVVLIVAAIWIVVRCVKGMSYISAKQAHPDPTTWMLG